MRRWLLGRLSSDVVVATAVAAVGLATAAALAPVRQATVAYELEADPSASVAPTGLARGVPDSLGVSMPCDAAASFSTLRLPIWADRSYAVVVEHPLTLPRDLGSGARFVVSEGVARAFNGDHQVLEVPVIDSADGCEVRFGYERGRWEIATGGRIVAAPGEPPVVAELSFGDDAAGGAAVVTTRELGSSPSVVGIVLRVLAVIATIPLLTWLGRTVGGRRGPPRRRFGLVDLGVLGILLVWVVVLPATIDEGGWRATIATYDRIGDFSDLFYHRMSPHPLGYWHKWLLHLWVSATSAPVLHRVPAAILGALGWWAARDAAVRLDVFDSVARRWLVAGAYLVGFGAWGMTLRPEPMVSLLAIVSLGLSLRFAGGQRGWVLPAWIAVMALSITVHPIGIVATAPALARWREVYEWLRLDRRWVAAGAALSSLTLLLVFLDSNLWTKNEAISAFRAGAQHATPWAELDRYAGLERVAPPMGRLAVVVAVASVVLLLLRRRRRRDVASLPALSVGVGLLLLSLDAAKWHWKFGTVLGLAAVALAAEAKRVRRRHTLLAALMASGALAWVWSDALAWGWFDLRTQVWWRGAVNLFRFDLASPLTWFVVAAVGAVATRVWFGKWHPVAPVGAVLGVGMATVVVITTATLVVDDVRTDGWTFTSQNLDALVGRADCGVAEELLVPVRGSLRALIPAPEIELQATGASSSPTQGFMDLLESRGSVPLPFDDGTESWFVAPAADRILAFAASTTQDPSIEAEWIRDADPRQVETSQAVVQAVHPDWTLVEFAAPAGASHIRLRAEGADMAITVPGTMDMEPLASSTAITLVTPELLQFTPCVDVPVPDGGLLEPPDLMLLVGRPGRAFQDPYILAGTPDRYFSMPISIAAGDFPITILASQEHLTGQPSRATATARLIDASGR